ncbi:hypothetical protein [Parabacteroides sp. merdae-related_45_40]|jgi:hypothetical protein|uniref:hypothetical protein n=1 Tax=Parabacteroides sp. merdae-related_45_40 TaxID=1897013 RepID=UPI000964B296|nr:hypothetical protein [Parabacteroides sp. merdae-related_45_40]OKZ31421.1 MAG: hypothetical protein BHV83_11405 [Parabacteroides sp. merdae-related_45_40]
MGLFNAYKTVNRANQLLKEMEAQFDIIYYNMECGSPLQQIRVEWRILKKQFMELQETISSSSAASIASYRFKGRQATTMELFSFIKSILDDLDMGLKEQGA